MKSLSKYTLAPQVESLWPPERTGVEAQDCHVVEILLVYKRDSAGACGDTSRSSKLTIEAMNSISWRGNGSSLVYLVASGYDSTESSNRLIVRHSTLKFNAQRAERTENAKCDKQSTNNFDKIDSMILFSGPYSATLHRNSWRDHISGIESKRYKVVEEQIGRGADWSRSRLISLVHHGANGDRFNQT